MIDQETRSTNHIGWEIQVLTQSGWIAYEDLGIFPTHAEARSALQRITPKVGVEYRVYEAIDHPARKS